MFDMVGATEDTQISLVEAVRKWQRNVRDRRVPTSGLITSLSRLSPPWRPYTVCASVGQCFSGVGIKSWLSRVYLYATSFLKLTFISSR